MIACRKAQVIPMKSCAGVFTIFHGKSTISDRPWVNVSCILVALFTFISLDVFSSIGIFPSDTQYGYQVSWTFK